MDGDKVEILANQALKSARESREAKLAEFEARRVARSLVVPTDDKQVQTELRARSQPICYYGEDAHDRRERLRQLMATEVINERKLGGFPNKSDKEDAENEGEEEGDDDEADTKQDEKDYFTEGSTELKQLRLSLTKPSLLRAQARLEHERSTIGNSEQSNSLRLKLRQAEQDTVTAVRQSNVLASYIGDTRPLSAIAYGETAGNNNSGEVRLLVATASWGGRLKLWDMNVCNDLKPIQSIEDAHTGRVSMLRIVRCNDTGGNVLLSSAADGLAHIFASNDNDSEIKFELKCKLDTHGGERVSDIDMHPFRHSLVATAGFDGCVVLHDDGRNVVHQKTGHEKVYRLSFHPDGSLLSTCGLDGGIRVWDLRSGRAVMTMIKAHADDVLGVQFCPGGRVLASCGADNVARIWDLRSTQCVKTIAAHRNLVSAVKFGGGGDVLWTCSFDASVKCWGAKRNWGLLCAHTAFEDKVTAVDSSRDGRTVVAGCYDKTWKVIGGEDA